MKVILDTFAALYIYIYIYVYIYIYICVCVCVCVCALHMNVQTCMYYCCCIHYIYIYIYIYMYIYMCMYVCMYIYIYIHLIIHSMIALQLLFVQLSSAYIMPVVVAIICIFISLYYACCSRYNLYFHQLILCLLQSL